MMFEDTTEGFLMRIGFSFPSVEGYKAITPIDARYEGFPTKIAAIMKKNPIKIKKRFKTNGNASGSELAVVLVAAAFIALSTAKVLAGKPIDKSDELAEAIEKMNTNVSTLEALLDVVGKDAKSI